MCLTLRAFWCPGFSWDTLLVATRGVNKAPETCSVWAERGSYLRLPSLTGSSRLLLGSTERTLKDKQSSLRLQITHRGNLQAGLCMQQWKQHWKHLAPRKAVPLLQEECNVQEAQEDTFIFLVLSHAAGQGYNARMKATHNKAAIYWLSRLVFWNNNSYLSPWLQGAEWQPGLAPCTPALTTFYGWWVNHYFVPEFCCSDSPPGQNIGYFLSTGYEKPLPFPVLHRAREPAI